MLVLRPALAHILRYKVPVAGGVAFDAVSEGEAVNANNATWNHVAAGNPSAIAILIGQEDATDTITGVTVGGVSASHVVSSTINSANQLCHIYALANPGSGTKQVVVSFTGTTLAGCGAITVTGSDTTTVMSNSAANQANSGTAVSVTCGSAASELVVDIMRATVGTSTPDASQTERWANNTFTDVHGSTRAGASPNVSMQWTKGTNSAWCIAAASFKAA